MKSFAFLFVGEVSQLCFAHSCFRFLAPTFSRKFGTHESTLTFS